MRILGVAVAALSVVALVGAASAQPTKLSKDQMAKITAGGTWSTTQLNGGGNTPQGNANGVPTTTYNPGGNPPPGRQ